MTRIFGHFPFTKLKEVFGTWYSRTANNREANRQITQIDVPNNNSNSTFFNHNQKPEKKKLPFETVFIFTQLWKMAVASTSSLASQLSGPKSSYSCPHFSGLRPSSLNSVSFSTTQSFFQNVDSQLRLSSSQKGCRAVVTMAGSGKVKPLN